MPRATRKLKIKPQVLVGDEIAFGPGKAELLEWVDRTGSISAAAKGMGLSYRRAWLMVDTMNRCFREPLVTTAHGGAKGGGAALSDAGREVLAAFRGLEADLQGAAEARSLSLLSRLAD